MRAQNLRPLAVLTKQRNSALPDVPTLDETVLPGFDLIAWAGIFAPAGTPPEIVNTLAREVEKSIAKPELKKQFTTLGIDVFWAGPEQFQKYVKTELVKWTAMIKESWYRAGVMVTQIVAELFSADRKKDDERICSMGDESI